MKNQERDLSANKGTFVAIALCVALYLAWNQYLQRKYPGFGERRATTTTQVTESHSSATDPQTNPQTNPAAETTAPANAAPAAPAAPTVAKMAPADLTFDSRDITFTFSQELASAGSARLKTTGITITPTALS